MGLGPDAVDGNTGGDPLLDVRDHAVRHFCGVGLVEVVVVDVELGGRVRGAGGLEGDAHKVLA